MIDAALSVGANSRLRLQQLLDRSHDALRPLDDPLQVDFGLHRWLSEDREESYSDWLHWILAQLKNPELVFEVLGIDQPATVSRCSGLPFSVTREEVIQQGRLDLVVRYGTEALVLIEVKVSSAEDSDTEKNEGYSLWLRQQCYNFRHSILICTDAQQPDYRGFVPVRWAEVCVNLRRMIPKLLVRGRAVLSAMILAFVGAIEQNLLAFPHLGSEQRPAALLQMPRIVAYLERSLEREE